MNNFLPLAFLALLLIFQSCSSGKKALEKGNYYEAVMKSIHRLRKNPSHKKSAETLRSGYVYALGWLENDAKNQIASNAPFKWNRVIASYEKINRMYEAIQKSPGARRIISNPRNHYSDMAEIKEKAAKESYEAGVAAMLKDTRNDAKKAYYHFKDAQKMVPGYKDVNDMMKEAKFMATLKVVVHQIPVPTRYRLSAGFFQDKVEQYLSHDLKKEFVHFYTPKEAENENLPFVDQYLKVAFDDFTVGQTHTIEKTETLSKDSVVVGEVKMEDGSKVKAYNTVKAKLTTYKKEIISQGRVNLRVIDANSGAVLTHKKFDGQFVWFSEWGSFNGDERALSEKDIKRCKQREVPPPPPQDMFIEFTKPIYAQLTRAVKDFYNKY